MEVGEESEDILLMIVEVRYYGGNDFEWWLGVIGRWQRNVWSFQES